ncbi:MAG: KilA-N domain-containing protein [Bacteroidetes bacterium]|nr:KilA-N domain-containing protein [Bacteroidota bacterium]
MSKNKKITIQGTEIMLFSHKKEDYISLTDMARYKDSMETSLVISHWMSTRYTVEFLGIWESLNNPDFKPTEFSRFKMESGSNGFVLTPKRWAETTNAIGIFSKAGRYGGGTFAHKDIAFEFASWLSAEFKYLIIREFQRLKEDENQRLSLEWSLQRTLSKVNYQIHTSAISQNLIPKTLTKAQINYIYASEADLLNVALFGMTAKEWREANPGKDGNMRDDATLEQLVVLSNMESINALLIQQKLTQAERLQQLNNTAIMQMQTLLNSKTLKALNN